MTNFENPFDAPLDKSAQEADTKFAPRFDQDGLISAIICDATSGAVLMLGYMNAQSLSLTLETGESHFWSRSRNQLWHKGATSGNTQKVREIRTDCDQDALLVFVDVEGHEATCHTGRTSCFYRVLEGKGANTSLRFTDDQPKFDPKAVYSG